MSKQYPLRLTGPNGKRYRVTSEAEHQRLLATFEPVPEPAPTEPAPVAVPENALLAPEPPVENPTPEPAEEPQPSAEE